jgi:hypothetical protein
MNSVERVAGLPWIEAKPATACTSSLVDARRSGAPYRPESFVAPRYSPIIRIVLQKGESGMLHLLQQVGYAAAH